MVLMGCQDNESCSNILNFLERLDVRSKCTHRETAAVIKLKEDRNLQESLTMLQKYAVQTHKWFFFKRTVI